MSTWRIINSDVRDGLASLPSGSARCCVTSPPYWGLRDYGVAGQLGLESTPDAYVAAMVDVFREVRRVLADDGTLWLNLGDSYARAGGWSDNHGLDGVARGESGRAVTGKSADGSSQKLAKGCKEKDLVGIPWMVAFALRADGWYLRSDIIWSKPNPMPESVTDRPTKAHEYIFLLTKSAKYFYDATAIMETVAQDKRPQRVRADELFREHGLTDRHLAAIRACGISDTGKALITTNGAGKNDLQVQALATEAQRVLGGYYREFLIPSGRNKRSVWAVATQSYPEAHFATFPEKLIEPCILAGSALGDTVLDPFTGSGTTGAVAVRHQRSFVGTELNPAYVELARKRIGAVAPLLAQEETVAV